MYKLVKIGNEDRPSFELQRDGLCVAFFVWQEWHGPRRQGFQYIPNAASRGRSRTLKPNLRDALTLLGRLRAPVANALILSLDAKDIEPLKAA